MTISARKLSLLAMMCSLLSSCAQTGPPLPPSLELPRPPNDLHASRKGSQVTISWTEPALTTDRQSVRYLGPTRICRSPDAEMKECGIPIVQVPPPARSPSSSKPAAPRTQFYTDTLSTSLEEQVPTGEITYAVEVPNRDGRSAGLSNRVKIPAAPALPPPAAFAAQLTTEGVVLTWEGAADAPANPAIQHHYRIYRRAGDAGKDALVGEVPVQETGRVVDQNIEWEKTYLYRADVVTTVNLGFRPCSNATVPGADCAAVLEVEGDDTPQIKVFAHDVFPPAVPAGLQAVYSGEGQKPFIDLIWAPVTDADLAGYHVYRREADGAAVKLSTELVKSPSYRDANVASGKTYVYSVSSVDVRSNESARSEEASEPVP